METIQYTEPTNLANPRRSNIKFIAVLRTNKVTYWDSYTFGHEARPVGHWVKDFDCTTLKTAQAKAEYLQRYLVHGWENGAVEYHYKVDRKDLEVVILEIVR